MSVNTLVRKIREKNNPTVAGLDARLEYIPAYITEKYTAQYGKTLKAAAASMMEFNKGLIDALHDIVPEARRRDVKILLACQDARLFRAQMKEFSSWFTYVDFIPSVRAFPVFGARAVCFDGIGGLEMVNQRRMRAQRVQKWLLDRALSAVALAFALPLSVLIAAAIKLTSRGPVFYR